MLLDAPGMRPTAVCLFRHGDVDWLSSYQMQKVLSIYISRAFVSKGVTTGKNYGLNLLALLAVHTHLQCTLSLRIQVCACVIVHCRQFYP